jgi:site-specific recombinase XerD
MIALAPLLQLFFAERLVEQRHVSPQTVAAYRDAFRLLVRFASSRARKQPSELALQDLDAACIGDFLRHIETERRNGARTRNARLAAIHSFFRYVATREPAALDLVQRVLAIPHKRFDRALVTFLTPPEIDALLAAPDRDTWLGCRDHALLLVAVETGLRVSELTGLLRDDVHLGAGAHVRCSGKGRKERCTPLRSQSLAVLRAWFKRHDAPGPSPLFPSRRGTSLSRDAVERLVAAHAARAACSCPSLRRMTVSPHVLRHTSAMQLLLGGVDRSVIALWLGHESVETTQMYLHADLSIKERALARTAPPHTGARRYRPADSLLAFLEAL